MTDSFALMVCGIWASVASICYFAIKEKYPAWCVCGITLIAGIVTVVLKF